MFTVPSSSHHLVQREEIPKRFLCPIGSRINPVNKCDVKKLSSLIRAHQMEKIINMNWITCCVCFSTSRQPLDPIERSRICCWFKFSHQTIQQMFSNIISITIEIKTSLNHLKAQWKHYANLMTSNVCVTEPFAFPMRTLCKCEFMYHDHYLHISSAELDASFKVCLQLIN